ncbi:hypothetical protein ACHAXA_010096 [Cyclostephanos tholiformis]|uniref:Uncharacterized protein n=1 Tax=Cyclostephanos tholiformis TaxID=382380 RepID=A0ABD3RQR5_9STRA
MYGAYGQVPPQQQYGYHQQQQQQQQPQYAAPAGNHQHQQHQHQQGQQYQYPPHQEQHAQAAAVVEPEGGQQWEQGDVGGIRQPAPTIYVDTQHDDMVHDAQLDYYGTKLATGSSDRTIKVYDVSGDAYTPNATLTGHTGPIYQLSWSHPKYGPLLASASFDRSVLIHREVRPREWTLIKAFVGLHDSSVNSVQFCPHEHGLMACAASSDGRVSVLTHDGADDSWTVEYLSDTPLGVNSACWAPYSVDRIDDGGDDDDGTTAIAMIPSAPRIATGGCDNCVRVWRKDAMTGTWEEEAFVSSDPGMGHKDWVRDVAWAPNVIPGTSVVASCSEDRTVIVWKQGVAGGGEGDVGDAGGKWTPTLLNTFDDPVWRVSWSITGNILAVSSGDSNVTLWKEGLDGSWSTVSRVEDIATTTGGKGGAD